MPRALFVRMRPYLHRRLERLSTKETESLRRRTKRRTLQKNEDGDE